MLDLVVTPADCDVDALHVDPAGIISDHSLRRVFLAVAAKRLGSQRLNIG